MYHLNLKTGEPGVCRAKPGNCPLAAAGDHFATAQEAQKVYEDRMAEVTHVTVSKSSTGEFTNLSDHSDMKTLVPAIMSRGKSRNNPRQRWYGLHSGRMNPSNGDGDDYGHWGSGDSVILAERDGKRVRVISGSGSAITADEAGLGQPVTLIKQQHSTRDTETSGLHVLGWVKADGTKVGWVPDKRIHYFVFK